MTAVVVTLIGVGLWAGAQGYAQGAEDDSKATCSEATLRGHICSSIMDGVEIGENDHALFAVAGYEEHDGNGEVKGVASASVEEEIPSN